MVSKFGDVESSVGEIHDNPFGVGTLLSSPFMNVDVFQRCTHLDQILAVTYLEWGVENMVVVS